MTLVPRPIGEAEIPTIAAIADPVLRNLWITTAYHDLALGMAQIVGRTNVSWPAFATWASKTAGASIRGDVLPGRMQGALGRSWAYRRAVGVARFRLPGSSIDFDGDIFDAVRDAIAAVSQQIAAGNLLVFQELGPLFARMVSACAGQGAVSAAHRTALVDSMRAIDDDAEATARLRNVFTQYCDATLSPPPPTLADQILLANGLAGLTEQIRLQPNIQGALDAPIQVSLARWLENTVATLSPPLQIVARPLLHAVVLEVEEVWRRLATELLMRLVTPNGELDLGRDVPALPGLPLFPPDLGAIENPGLVALMTEFDATRGTGVGSGASDWAVLAQRMNYILTLFRSRQQVLDFLHPPFTDAQWAEMQQGRVPAGDL